MGPFSGVQFFRNGLLQKGYRSCQKTCSYVGFSPWTLVPETTHLQRCLFTTCSFKLHPPASMQIPPEAAGGSLLHCAPPWAAGHSSPDSPCSCPQAAREFLLWALEQLLSLLLHWPRCLQGCFSHIFLTPLTAATPHFLPVLKYVIMDSALTSSGSICELALSDWVRKVISPASITKILPPASNNRAMLNPKVNYGL